MNRNLIIWLIVFLVPACSLYAQEKEVLAPLDHNMLQLQPRTRTLNIPKKTTAISLPFFEDFTGYSIYPDADKWIGHTVYINNTMCSQPISRGVATFDGLNAQAGPYDSLNMTALVYADSLTSQPLAMAAHTPADSIYLSFFYQPQGFGFAPEESDSLMLYFRKKNNAWTKVWGKEGGEIAAFTQVMIPVTDTSYFHDGFQFRFVNKASLNLNDDVWNLDYIRMAAGRNRYDTAVNDVAASSDPSFLLNDLTSMPYRQFTANAGNELAAQHAFAVRNNYDVNKATTYGYTARESETNTPLSGGSTGSGNIAAFTEQYFQFPVYTTGFAPGGMYDKVVFEQQYYVTTTGTESKTNDTIVKEQVFDNYLAYDDGTAEKSYFLKQFATLPAKLAIEFHLNEPDTVRGIAIYFGRQVPLAFNKFFSAEVYKDIAVNGGTDNLVYEEDLLFPGYVDTINHFWVYRFTDPVVLPAGTFFLGAQQGANSGADSLYYGLDANRVGGNHLYINVNNFWEPSQVTGAVMIRPVLGQRIVGTKAEEMPAPALQWTVSPNPAKDHIHIQLSSAAKHPEYQIMDMQGRIVMQGDVSHAGVDVSALAPAMYLVRIIDNNQASIPKKIVKY